MVETTNQGPGSRDTLGYCNFAVTELRAPVLRLLSPGLEMAANCGR